ncbi:DNA-binding NtrC family response regulator [Neolewinella xylanilytica]|uniref:DNA-binding transcriptional regulator NtrC n=1 Tax=Neolewinella xylanilytica TaxID=1514080 RepID=A0A2S6I8M5_9BACT|nr:sigma-54 dependent transcriptional regulator [Neolewinella xylanilytica]PPK87832.1 DNA-binding NtrC family response regulator [Neolewinella xylanilytica]
MLSIFIVEDDPFYGSLLQHHLRQQADFEVRLLATGTACLEELYREPDVISMDYGLPDMNGGELLNRILEKHPSIAVIVTSGQEDIATAVSLLQQGARDYLVKNENTKDLLWKSIQNISEAKALKREVADLREQLSEKFSFDSVIGRSPAMQQVFSVLRKAVRSQINVTITGETGTGKEVVARAIHYNGPRRNEPFVAINTAAIPADLLESELFGHEKGAFTGATERKIGRFEAAGEGTLFLDEVAEMDLNLQSKLLRALQEREFCRVGSNSPVTFRARLLTATHRDLGALVRQGKFREDLYYRIMGLPVELPPLRRRGEDLLLLANFFLDMYARDNGTKRAELGPAAKDKLLKHPFPGNVRELKAVIDLACVLSETGHIVPEDLKFSTLNGPSAIDYGDKTLREYNREIIQHYLTQYDRNVSSVAEKLNVGKSTIYGMIKSGEVSLR